MTSVRTCDWAGKVKGGNIAARTATYEMVSRQMGKWEVIQDGEVDGQGIELNARSKRRWQCGKCGNHILREMWRMATSYRQSICVEIVQVLMGRDVVLSTCHRDFPRPQAHHH